MDDCTKVLVYGSFDGFAHSTDSSLLISVVLDGGEKVEIPEEFIVSADQMVNKYKIKLKDVIARIEKFDLATKAVWINEILNELGSEYGAFKYKAGYEQGKFDGAMEHEKVTVPQFVADWYEEYKDNLEYNIWDWTKYNLEPKKRENVIFSQWLGKTVNNPVETLIKMKLYGYEVEKEKRYYVRFKWIEESYCYLTLIKHLNAWTLSSIKLDKKFRTEHTKKQLEEAGFGWVFDCPGIEIEEVEE